MSDTKSRPSSRVMKTQRKMIAKKTFLLTTLLSSANHSQSDLVFNPPWKANALTESLASLKATWKADALWLLSDLCANIW